MEATALKRSLLSNILARLLSFGVLVFLARFSYIITVKGRACDPSTSDFCFFTKKIHIDIAGIDTFSAAAASLRSYYSSVFEDLIAEGYLSPDSKTLCIETLTGQDVAALRDVGVADSIGISRKSSPPLVRYGHPFSQPFGDNIFDFEFSGVAVLERTAKPVEFALEVTRTLKPGGLFVVHTSGKDEYSLNSLLQLFDSFKFVRAREIDNSESSASSIREIVLKKESGYKEQYRVGNSANIYSFPEYKRGIIRIAEPLIEEEPLKPWITFKRNIKNVKYLSSMVDISFKNRYVYVDVGARSYGSSIGGWFNKQYPKQNKTFAIYAIEADRAFHDEYRMKKRVTLLPYAAWVKNETLFFEINREPRRKNNEKGRGMGRIQAAQSSFNYVGDLYKIQGFDFASWLKLVASEKDYVVVKMDVEGAEFHLIPKLFKTGAIYLIDEMFLECHYNRWQRCCPGERSLKYQKTYTQCLDLFFSLRERGVLVHQWW